VADHQVYKRGNFQSYNVAPYAAYTGMWGTYLPQNDKLKAEATMLAFPATFPDGTILTWDVTPDPDWGGINGYLHVSYGNYDYSPGLIPSRQVKAVQALAVTIGWTFEGDPSSGLLAECWLTSKSTPSGPVETKTHEVAFLPKLSPASGTWAQSLPLVGAFTDRYGVKWNVGQAQSASGGVPYYAAYRTDRADFRGTLRFDDLFAFLTAAKKLTGSEWFNGLAFGVEPQSGAGALTVDRFAVAYT
jgi:hypothetical protein